MVKGFQWVQKSSSPTTNHELTDNQSGEDTKADDSEDLEPMQNDQADI